MQQAEQSSNQTKETDRTAELDNHGILQMQQDIMQEQDQSLEAMEQSVASTRVCSASFFRWEDAEDRLLCKDKLCCTHT